MKRRYPIDIFDLPTRVIIKALGSESDNFVAQHELPIDEKGFHKRILIKMERAQKDQIARECRNLWGPIWKNIWRCEWEENKEAMREEREKALNEYCSTTKGSSDEKTLSHRPVCFGQIQ